MSIGPLLYVFAQKIIKNNMHIYIVIIIIIIIIQACVLIE